MKTDSFITFGNIDTTLGYGIRDYGGTLYFNNSGGRW
jgi:hypothetical protein